ncbi:uncharacterized protein AMSG_07877 [Thecamonas trahens ATCC 50062]|uniref:Exportin-1/Importin-beta-like domain-containing protein n=1 Tax=Thecamonas trahens ATCC 50062 TaxID=461836 RepID=A0A0L0DI74_THETB|nr:hypothetical protein AMSG_07877 [Thecamonas trahens ATCC 50062]KNC51801.1 hypothetical protein AMSG_07877 [Thecamonas trahens ATCC 50062]|eukprot:XP_013755669.1 hypothetical protein AMSG_07877 [Thecamonas trahens ATCC 50062]
MERHAALIAATRGDGAFSVPALDAVVRDLFEPSAAEPELAASANQALLAFQAWPGAWQTVPDIVDSTEYSPTRAIALALLDDAIANPLFARLVPLHQWEAIASWLTAFLAAAVAAADGAKAAAADATRAALAADTAGSDPAGEAADAADDARDAAAETSALAAKAASMVVTLAVNKLWPAHWPGLVTELVQGAASSRLAAVTNLGILADLASAVVAVLAPGSARIGSKAAPPVVNADRRAALAHQLELDFPVIVHLAIEAAATPDDELSLAALAALASFAEWMPPALALSSQLLDTLMSAAACPTPQLAAAAAASASRRGLRHAWLALVALARLGDATAKRAAQTETDITLVRAASDGLEPELQPALVEALLAAVAKALPPAADLPQWVEAAPAVVVHMASLASAFIVRTTEFVADAASCDAIAQRVTAVHGSADVLTDALVAAATFLAAAVTAGLTLLRDAAAASLDDDDTAAVGSLVVEAAAGLPPAIAGCAPLGLDSLLPNPPAGRLLTALLTAAPQPDGPALAPPASHAESWTLLSPPLSGSYELSLAPAVASVTMALAESRNTGEVLAAASVAIGSGEPDAVVRLAWAFTSLAPSAPSSALAALLGVLAQLECPPLDSDSHARVYFLASLLPAWCVASESLGAPGTVAVELAHFATDAASSAGAAGLAPLIRIVASAAAKLSHISFDAASPVLVEAWLTLAGALVPATASWPPPQGAHILRDAYFDIVAALCRAASDAGADEVRDEFLAAIDHMLLQPIDVDALTAALADRELPGVLSAVMHLAELHAVLARALGIHYAALFEAYAAPLTNLALGLHGRVVDAAASGSVDEAIGSVMAVRSLLRGLDAGLRVVPAGLLASPDLVWGVLGELVAVFADAPVNALLPELLAPIAAIVTRAGDSLTPDMVSAVAEGVLARGAILIGEDTSSLPELRLPLFELAGKLLAGCMAALDDGGVAAGIELGLWATRHAHQPALIKVGLKGLASGVRALAGDNGEGIGSERMLAFAQAFWDRLWNDGLVVVFNARNRSELAAALPLLDTLLAVAGTVGSDWPAVSATPEATKLAEARTLPAAAEDGALVDGSLARHISRSHSLTPTRR